MGAMDFRPPTRSKQHPRNHGPRVAAPHPLCEIVIENGSPEPRTRPQRYLDDDEPSLNTWWFNPSRMSTLAERVPLLPPIPLHPRKGARLFKS